MASEARLGRDVMEHIVHNIVHQPVAVRELDPSENELREFVKHAAVPLHRLAEDGTIIWANDAELTLTGYSRGEYVGHNIVEFHASNPAILEMLQRLKSGEEPGEYESQLRRKDGAIRHVSTSSHVYRKAGRFVHAQCATRDVTQEKSIPELQERLAAIVESSDDAILSKDLNGIIQSWNRGAERIFGYKAEEIIGKHISTLAAPDCLEEIPDILQRIARGERFDHYETKRKPRREGF